MTAHELIELLTKAPEAEVRVAVVECQWRSQSGQFDRAEHVILYALALSDVTLNPEANTWIIEP